MAVKALVTCPKCGGQAFRVHLADVDEWISDLECIGCSAKIPTKDGEATLDMELAG